MTFNSSFTISMAVDSTAVALNRLSFGKLFAGDSFLQFVCHFTD